MSELIELSCRQLDTEIALLRGWKWQVVYGQTARLVFAATQKSAALLSSTVPDGFKLELDEVPHFSTEIAAAWPLLQEMQEDGYYLAKCFRVYHEIDEHTPQLEALSKVLFNLSPLTIACTYYFMRTGHCVTITEQEGNDAA